MDFYDDLARYYHLIFADWDASMARQAEDLDRLIQAAWPGSRRVLDVACGIGTQALGLAARGYDVAGSDLSVKAVERAREEAARRGLAVGFSVADMREARAAHGDGFDVVIAADNAVPHLPTDEDILHALRAAFACVRPGGGCLFSVRDYDAEPRGRNIVKHHGVRTSDAARHVLFQVWDFDGDHYDVTFFVVEETLATGATRTLATRARYYAISTVRLCELMREAGFEKVNRLDGVFFQPVVAGTRPIA